MTKVLKRQNGTIVSAILAGNHQAVPVAVPKGMVAETQVPKKSGQSPKRAKKGSANIEAHVSGDASDGQKLAVKLHTLIHSKDIDDEERCKQVFKLGKLAKQIGSGDPDVQAALQAAKKNQIESIPETDSQHLDTQGLIFDTWGAAFIGGFTTKLAVKGEATPKPYLLRVTIPEYRNGVDKVAAVEKDQKFEKFGDAERAANRWWVQKSEQGEHDRMTVTIHTIDLEASAAAEEDVIIPSLDYVVTREAAAAKMETQRRREKAQAALAGKAPPRRLSFGVKVKETRVTFSRG